MAASPTPRPSPASETPNPALAPLRALELPLPLAVAYSGGADSTALLHAACARWPGQVQAIHIHHGLQAAADVFQQHCETECARLCVPLHRVRVAAGHEPGESPEDAARRARYRALAGAAVQHGMRCVLLAQHADDQVETLLLALSRGAGLPGLAAMPACFERHGMRFVRPLLALGAGELRAWLRQARVGFVEDPTNADTGYTRNRIRHEVLPALERAFPSHRETFARSARHAAQAQLLLSQLADHDLAQMGGQPRVSALRQLPPERQANLLRHWLRRAHQCAATAAQLDELLRQLLDCTTHGHRIQIKVAAGQLRREGDLLVYLPKK
jgi:tRNA(Ile)-lysidine synthase